MRNRSILILMALLFCFSCHSNKKNGGLLGIDSMKVVMWDMLRADELYQRISIKDSMAKKNREDIRLYEQVFRLHKISRGLFDSSYKYYEAHPPEFKILMDSLDYFSTRERTKVYANKYGPQK